MAAAGVLKKRKRNDLTLEQKYIVIKTSKKSPKPSIRKLAEEFRCGKTQISTILQNEAKVLEMYEENASGAACQLKRVRNSKFGGLNDSLWQWYCMATSRNLFPDGPLLMEKAKKISHHLGHPDGSFKASNGWLESWKKRYNIKQVVVSEESGDVSGDTISSWRERLPEIVDSYSPSDVWNIDETGCFWRALPEKGFGRKGQECKGGKKAKHRATIAFIVNAAGQSECMPIVIWKSNSPRCFKHVDKGKLPVQYFSQRSAWMTGDILDTVLKKLNHQLKCNGRSVLLLLDNAGCHPPELKDKYSNIKLVFLPPNTTSKLQPLDLGIIKNFKVYYRKLLLKYIVAKIDQHALASEVAKTINILQAIRWIAEAWQQVSCETILKCFRKAGILTKEFEMRSLPSIDQDPFADCDEVENPVEESELTGLISQIQLQDACSADELIKGEDLIPICTEVTDEDWEESFFAELGPASKRMNEEDGCEDDSEGEEEEPVLLAPKVKSYSDAIESLEDVLKFLENKSHTDEATSLSSLISAVIDKSYIASTSTKQSLITEYF